MDSMAVGVMLCKARKKQKITQCALGQRVGMDKSYISRIENGNIQPTVSTFLRLLWAMDLDIAIVEKK